MASNTAGLRRGGGRPKGAKNKTTAEIRAVAKALVEDRIYVAHLRKRLVDGKAPHMETLLFQYAYGKPKDEEGFDGRFLITWQAS